MVTETTWVRSVYLYVLCAVSIGLVGLGAVTAAVGVVHTVAPDLGHRDTLDRVGIGLANIGGNVVELFGEGELDGLEEFCESVTDGPDELDECIEDEQSASGDPMASIQDGIAEVKDELRNQIRNSSIDRLIRGVLMVGAGLVLFRIHGPRTTVFADGLMPRRRTPEPDGPPEPPLPPPPPA